MSDNFRELTQSEIDSLVGFALPNYEDAPFCSRCKVLTKRMLFQGQSTMRMKVIDQTGNRLFRGKIQSGTMFCFSCGKFSMIGG